MKKIFLILSLTIICFLQVFSCFANDINTDEKPKIERHFVFDTIPLNLEELVNAAGKIFSGKCIKVRNIEDDPKAKLPVIEYTFKITEIIKGISSDTKEITIRQWEPTGKTAGYDAGNKYVVFLYPTNDRGLTSPVALSQGRFDIESSGFIRRREVVKNSFNNKGLYRNLKTRAKVTIKEDKFIDDYLSQCSESGAPMRYGEFIKAVRYLAERQQ